MANETLLRETLDAVIAADAEGRWVQHTWLVERRCGTGGCFAGWRVILDGGAMVRVGGIAQSNVALINGQEFEVSDYATKRLGLTLNQALLLFDLGNRLPDLKEIVDLICEGRL